MRWSLLVALCVWGCSVESPKESASAPRDSGAVSDSSATETSDDDALPDAGSDTPFDSSSPPTDIGDDTEISDDGVMDVADASDAKEAGSLEESLCLGGAPRLIWKDGICRDTAHEIKPGFPAPCSFALTPDLVTRCLPLPFGHVVGHWKSPCTDDTRFIDAPVPAWAMGLDGARPAFASVDLGYPALPPRYWVLGSGIATKTGLICGESGWPDGPVVGATSYKVPASDWYAAP